MSNPSKPIEISPSRRYIRELEDGLRLEGEIGLCVFTEIVK